ncbi:dihydrofolate reductase family protein [Streptomyces sp. NPDC047108]|uniref:dihydrofolate reductase family protein n=1 Tax=Streptomyces sp. NPDC047108 TaxID=3155025 RepID=UPI0033EE3E2C
MRKIVLFLGMSLDGYFEGPNREIDWHQVDDELHRHMNETIRAMGGILAGRITHELMAAYWPTVDADPSVSETELDFAGIWREMPKIVYSRTMEDTTDWNTTVKREVVVEEIEELKAQPGGDLVVGGPDLAETFRRHDLIDEYQIYVHPVLLGRGRPLFHESDVTVGLRLIESRTFGNGVVMLRYERLGPLAR